MTPGPDIAEGYRPGLIAGVVGLHAEYYSRHWGFGLTFEAKVAAELAAFLQACDPQRDLVLAAWEGDRLVGSIVIDRSVTGGGGAHLRWFIVGEEARGGGLGRVLMSRAMRFCEERGYDPVWLTTFSGLDAARRLYEAAGFRLAGESEEDQWRGGVREQRFERRAAG